MKSFWDEEKIASLKDLWNRGWTASEIGARMGASRNAVLGKIHRLGDAGRSRMVVVVDASKLQERAQQRRENHAANERRRRERIKSSPGRRSVPAVIRPLFMKSASLEFKAPVLKRGMTRTSPEYRNQLGFLPDMTVGQRRDMLAEAMRNTAAMPVEG